MTRDVDTYLAEGCGRCHLGGTPDCKVHTWNEELVVLRRILLDCGLTEESKWGVPCYTYRGANVVVASAFKEYCALSFFKGALLKDTHGILKKPGENSQAARLIQFTDIQELVDMEPVIKEYLFEAVEIEKAGLKVAFKAPGDFTIPEEFQARLDGDPALQDAFAALTPGRQRGYILHFSAPKQAKTRESRIDKCTPRILDGKGMHDR